MTIKSTTLDSATIHIGMVKVVVEWGDGGRRRCKGALTHQWHGENGKVRWHIVYTPKCHIHNSVSSALLGGIGCRVSLGGRSGLFPCLEQLQFICYVLQQLDHHQRPGAT